MVNFIRMTFWAVIFYGGIFALYLIIHNLALGFIRSEGIY